LPVKRFKGCKNGQFVVLAAVIIAAFMFSLVLTVSQISTSRQEVVYEPIDEFVLAIISDFERCLTRALAIATQKYEETYNITLAKFSGKAFIENWLKVALESYSGFGIKVALLPENSTEIDYVDWRIEWIEENGISRVYTTFGINVETYGLRKLAVIMRKVVSLEILHAKIDLTEAGSIMTIKFRVEESGSKYKVPVLGLTRDNLVLLVNGSKGVSYEISGVKYMGQGIYEVQFSLDNLVAESVTLIVFTRDGIRVGASLRLCSLILLSDDLVTPDIIDNEGYFIVNGTSCSPLHVLSLFPNQTLIISFTPPEGSYFKEFLFSGPLDSTSIFSPTTVRIVKSGLGNITARYNSSVIEDTMKLCYVTLGSREADDESFNKGRIEVNEVNYTLPALIVVPCNQTLRLTYYRESGYVFEYWEFSGNINKLSGNNTAPSIEVAVKGNGTIIAVYSESRPADWRRLYFSPLYDEKGREKKERFTLTLNRPKDNAQITPTFNRPHDDRTGSISGTPELYFGNNIIIKLNAKYNGPEASVPVNVTLGFRTNDGATYIIGSDIKNITHEKPYSYTFIIYPSFKMVPAGSTIFLIIDRLDNQEKGTLQIDCNPEESYIELW